jgi:hypothetical protein
MQNAQHHGDDVMRSDPVIQRVLTDAVPPIVLFDSRHPVALVVARVVVVAAGGSGVVVAAGGSGVVVAAGGSGVGTLVALCFTCARRGPTRAAAACSWRRWCTATPEGTPRRRRQHIEWMTL